MPSKKWRPFFAVFLLAATAFIMQAETYLTEDQAAAVLFPGVKMTSHWTDLSAQEMKMLELASGQTSSSSRVRVWWGPAGQALFMDSVLGKQEFITYAVAVNPDGKIKGVEIMDDREIYGAQIRDKTWLQNFVGKSAKDPLTLGKDIPDISGATLTARHVTEGVRRILQTYELLKSKA
jgi:Na+-translocating ferredoxin:NAD+ oxidoreductase RnfG subunit